MRFTQDATYWAPFTTNEFNEITYVAPVPLKVRWEDKLSKMNTPEGKEVMSKAIVYSQIDLAIDGHLFLGTSLEGNPDNVPDAHLILFFGNTPNLSGTKSVRKSKLGVE